MKMIHTTTGFGLIRDGSGRVINRIAFEPGSYPIEDDQTFEEKASEEEANQTPIFVPPIPEETIAELRIMEKLRQLAVAEIKKEDPTFVDPTTRRNP